MEEFIIVKHDAKKRGTHYDIRFKIPNKKKWASFATTKNSEIELPPKSDKRITLIRTHDHNENEAKFTGEIKSGYGAGKLTELDSGKCDVIKFSRDHMIVDFKGKKLKGKYHFINTNVYSNKKDKDNKIFQFFKSKK